MEHHINQLRHDGTRVVPVFVLALQNHPEDVVMANKCVMPSMSPMTHSTAFYTFAHARCSYHLVCAVPVNITCSTWQHPSFVSAFQPPQGSDVELMLSHRKHVCLSSWFCYLPFCGLYAPCRELVAASEDAVVVLQLRQGSK